MPMLGVSNWIHRPLIRRLLGAAAPSNILRVLRVNYCQHTPSVEKLQMLSTIEKDYVVEVLSKRVAPLQSPREAVTAPFIGTLLPERLRQGLPREVVADAVRLCLEDGWSHEPPWLILLLEFHFPATLDEKLDAIRERLRIPPPLSLSPLDATILGDGTPFVNRHDLRNQLRRLATPASSMKPILVVVGDPQSGKSYTTQYIDHFSYNQPPITTYRIAFTEETALEMGPAEVASDLVAMMGRSVADIPKAQTNQKLHVRNLATWVLNEAVQVATNHWIMLDNFNGPMLRPDTRDFVVALSDLVTTGVFAQKCRVILIGFDRALLTVDPGKVDEEDVNRCLPSDIETCIDEIVKRASEPLTRSRLVSHVFDGLPVDVTRMKRLNGRLRELVLAISAIKEIKKRLPNLEFDEVLLEMLVDLPADDVQLIELKTRLKVLRKSAEEG